MNFVEWYIRNRKELDPRRTLEDAFTFSSLIRSRRIISSTSIMEVLGEVVELKDYSYFSGEYSDVRARILALCDACHALRTMKEFSDGGRYFDDMLHLTEIEYNLLKGIVGSSFFSSIMTYYNMWYVNYSDVDCSGKEKSGHKVWSVLNKDKYVEEYYPVIEDMYDFIESLTKRAGYIVDDDGEGMLAMEKFFNLWNEYCEEVFFILSSIVRGGV